MTVEVYRFTVVGVAVSRKGTHVIRLSYRSVTPHWDIGDSSHGVKILRRILVRS